MAQWWIFIVVLLAFVAAVFLMFARARGASRMSSPMLRGKTRIIDEEYSICFAFDLQRNSDGSYAYMLKTDQEGMQQKVYGEGDLLDLNKHINVIGDQVYITRAVVARLAGDGLYSGMDLQLRRLKEELDEWQTRAKLAEANVDARVEKRVVDVTNVLKAVPRGKGKGGGF